MQLHVFDIVGDNFPISHDLYYIDIVFESDCSTQSGGMAVAGRHLFGVVQDGV